jgi:hypothetical protein
MVLAAPGCSKKDEPPKKTDGKAGGDGKPGTDGQAGKPKTGELTELAPPEWGTLTGTVTYDGDPPKQPEIKAMATHKDKEACHADASPRELVEQTWLVNPKNKGISDVAIFLKPPEGKYFKIHDSYLKQKGAVVELHQPHCAFIPHVLVYWASSYDKDSGELKTSGQKVKIMNDSKSITHNTAWAGDPDLNPKVSRTLEPGKDFLHAFTAQDTPIGIKCDIHTWMNAKCWALDNPYCARTDENGKFKIENVPAGVELHVVVWHEGAEYHFGKTGKAMKFEKGDNTLNFKLKAK